MKPSDPEYPALESVQQWMMTAITAPGGLPMGLQQAQAQHGHGIDDIIKAPRGISPHSRLDIYAQGYWLRLLACLKADYPGLQRLLGEELFDFFARAYLSEHPSHGYSLYDLGTGFSRFLRRTQNAAIKAKKPHVMRFPMELAMLEQARAACMRAAGMEGEANEPLDPAQLMMDCDAHISLPASTILLMASHPLDTFQPWLDGDSSESASEVGIGYIAVARRRFHVSQRELTDWQFYSLAAARRQPHDLLYCAKAAARRCHRPVHDILAQLAFWLPSAQAGGLIKTSRSGD